MVRCITMIWITTLLTKLKSLIEELKENGIYINSELSQTSDATFDWIIDANPDETGNFWEVQITANYSILPDDEKLKTFETIMQKYNLLVDSFDLQNKEIVFKGKL